MKSLFVFFLVIALFVACDLISPPEDQGEGEWELIDSAKQNYVFVSQEVPAIFYGGDGNKNYRSFDGETWEPFSTGFGVSSKVIAYSERVLYAICYTDSLYFGKCNTFALSKDNGQTWEKIDYTVGSYHNLPAPRCLCKNKHPGYGGYPLIGYFYFSAYSPTFNAVYGTAYPHFRWEKTGLPTTTECKGMLARKEGIYSISSDSLVFYSWDSYWEKWDKYGEEGSFSGLAEDTVNNEVWVEESNSEVIMKTSNGKTWDRVETDEVRNVIGGEACFAFYKDIIFVGHRGRTENNCLIFSKDNGKTWKKDGSLYGSIKGMGIFCDYLYVATDIGLFRKKL